MMKATTMAVLAGCLALALGATNYDGVFYQEVTSGSAPGFSSAEWTRTAESESALYVVDSQSGASMSVYVYDHNARAWTSIPTTGIASMRAVDIAYFSGSLLMFGGSSNNVFSNQLSVLPLSKSTWLPITTSNAPSARQAHTLTVWDGYAIVMGGENGTAILNDVWMYDLTQVMENPAGTSTKWINVLPDGSSAGFTKRFGHSVNTYEARMYIFGGFTRADGQVSQSCELPQAHCAYLQDTWIWIPDQTAATAGTLEKMQYATGSPVPPGRAGHVAAFVDDSHLYVFGGVGTGDVVLTDMWMLDEHPRMWHKLSPIGTLPSQADVSGIPLGSRIGRGLIVFPVDPSSAGYGFRYDPYDPFADFNAATPTPTAMPTQVCLDVTSVQGTTGGVVLILLLSLASLGFSGFVFWKYIRV